MDKRNWFLSAVVAAGALLGSPAAQAELTLGNWTFDASGIDGLPNNALYTSGPIDAWNFRAGFVQFLVDDNGNNVQDVGEHGVVSGLGTITAMENDGATVGNPLLGFNGSFMGQPGYEITFDFSVDYVVTAVDANNVNFAHTAPTNTTGLLNIYVDNLGAGGGQCSTTTGSGCTNGTLVGTFQIVAGEGGSINFVTFDGSDDATFEAVYLLDGVWFDEGGNDMGCNDALAGEECNGTPLLHSDSNLDSDPDENDRLDTNIAAFNCGLGAGPNGQSAPSRTCGSEDGSVILQIPEPASLAIFAIGLVMLGTLVGTLRQRAA